MAIRTYRGGASANPAIRIVSISCFVVATVVLGASLVGANEDALEAAPQSTPVKGGLCVLAGSADAALATRLAKDRPFLVNMLSTNPAGIAAARDQLFQDGLYGRVTIAEWAGSSLPYADNVISILILMDRDSAPESECLRALRPGGELLVKEGATFRKATKPRPAGMDEWNQWRHGPDRNPVSKDILVDVPQRIQWLSTQGKDSKETKEMVTANGRSFYLTGKNLLARDAFNGLPLWSTAIDPKCTAVASGNNVFVVSKGELRCINAMDGKQRRVYPAGAPLTVIHTADSRDPDGVLITADNSRTPDIEVSQSVRFSVFAGHGHAELEDQFCSREYGARGVE